MDPKFQSSFIPKGPTTSFAPGAVMGQKVQTKSLLSFLSIIIFTIAILLALGVFGYKFYLKYRIDQMGTDLEVARATLNQETITELTRLDSRMKSVQTLLARHRVLTPLFQFLEVSTPKTVRFNDLEYSMSEKGLEISMDGEARGYVALALLADIFSRSENFKDVIFSDLNLNEKGDVKFSFSATVDPRFLSYQREIESIGLHVATSTATTSPIQN